AQAKGTGRHVLVDRSARAASASHHELVQRLRAALRLGQFRLRYQPLVSTADGHMVGVEALLRWEDPLRGQVQPDDFVPLLEDSDAARRELGKLRQLGVRLAVDDYGTGYASVGYVRQLPLDVVKIDKCFVQGLTAGAEDAAIAQAIIKMAHALGLTTVAEGVENADELARLQQLGCDQVQGFYFSAPLTADAVDGLLRAGREVAVAS